MENGPNIFAFSPLNKEEKLRQARQQRTQKEIDDIAQGVVEAAKDCLTSDLFAKYREQYLEAERGLVELGCRLSIVDPVSYAIAAHSIFDRLNMLKMLGDSVTWDGREKKVPSA